MAVGKRFFELRILLLLFRQIYLKLQLQTIAMNCETHDNWKIQVHSKSDFGIFRIGKYFLVSQIIDPSNPELLKLFTSTTCFVGCSSHDVPQDMLQLSDCFPESPMVSEQHQSVCNSPKIVTHSLRTVDLIQGCSIQQGFSCVPMFSLCWEKPIIRGVRQIASWDCICPASLMSDKLVIDGHFWAEFGFSLFQINDGLVRISFGIQL